MGCIEDENASLNSRLKALERVIHPEDLSIDLVTAIHQDIQSCKNETLRQHALLIAVRELRRIYEMEQSDLGLYYSGSFTASDYTSQAEPILDLCGPCKTTQHRITVQRPPQTQQKQLALPQTCEQVKKETSKDPFKRSIDSSRTDGPNLPQTRGQVKKETENSSDCSIHSRRTDEPNLTPTRGQVKNKTSKDPSKGIHSSRTDKPSNPRKEKTPGYKQASLKGNVRVVRFETLGYQEEDDIQRGDDNGQAQKLDGGANPTAIPEKEDPNQWYNNRGQEQEKKKAHSLFSLRSAAPAQEQKADNEHQEDTDKQSSVRASASGAVLQEQEQKLDTNHREDDNKKVGKKNNASSSSFFSFTSYKLKVRQQKAATKHLEEDSCQSTKSNTGTSSLSNTALQEHQNVETLMTEPRGSSCSQPENMGVSSFRVYTQWAAMQEQNSETREGDDCSRQSKNKTMGFLSRLFTPRAVQEKATHEPQEDKYFRAAKYDGSLIQVEQETTVNQEDKRHYRGCPSFQAGKLGLDTGAATDWAVADPVTCSCCNKAQLRSLSPSQYYPAQSDICESLSYPGRIFPNMGECSNVYDKQCSARYLGRETNAKISDTILYKLAAESFVSARGLFVQEVAPSELARGRSSGVEISLPHNQGLPVIISVPSDLAESVDDGVRDEVYKDEEDVESSFSRERDLGKDSYPNKKFPKTGKAKCCSKGAQCVALTALVVAAATAFLIYFFLGENISSDGHQVEASVSSAAVFLRPSERPSMSPSQRPSLNRSLHPSHQPSRFPSGNPTQTPTVIPTFNPTQTPPTSAPTTIQSALYTIISLASPESANQTSFMGTPQYYAFHWLIDNSQLDVHSSMRIVQRYALAVFYFSTNGGFKWTVNNTGWLIEDDECSWFNLNIEPCLADSNVIIALELNQIGLSGTLPSELGLLSQLRVLKLSNNQGLIGQIPASLGNMSLLQVLELDGTGISGNLPSELGNATNLASIDLSGTPIEGRVPDSIGHLPFLDVLKLSSTAMYGDMPHSVCSKSPPSVVEWNCPDNDPCPCCTYCCYLHTQVCKHVPHPGL